MKKYFVYLMMALAAFTFNACGDDDPLQEEPGTEQPETPSDPTDNPDNPDDPANPDEPSGDGNILIAYFTRTNNTGTIAERIAELTGGTLYPIESRIPKIIRNVPKWHVNNWRMAHAPNSAARWRIWTNTTSFL